MSMDLNTGAFAQLGPMYNQLLSMTPDQIMQAGAPEFLKIAAMQQQGRARQAMLAPTPPSSTVAQDVVQQAVVPTGIGALPTSPAPVASGPTLAAAPAPTEPTAQMASGGLVDLETSPDMFSDRYYADGGIVAFANGGETERSGFFRTGTPLPRDRGLEQWIANKEDGPNKELLIKRYIQDRGLDPSMAMQLVRRGKMAPDTEEPELGVEEVRTAIGYTAPTSGKEPFSMREIAPEDEEAPVEQSGQGDYERFLAQMGGAGVSPAGMAGIAALGPEPTMPALQFAPEEASITEQQAIAEKNRSLAAAGVDREAEKARRQEMLGEKTSEYKERARRAPWEALIDAGLNIAAGTSQNALENIAKGAQQGFASYKEAAKELKQDKNVLDEIKSKVAEAEYAERLGDAEYANQRVREVEARKREASNKKIEMINTRNMTEFQVNAERHEKQLDRIQQANLANMQIRAQALTNAAKMAAELQITREKLQSDYEIATLGLQSSTIKALASASEKGAMTQKQYADTIRLIMQDSGISEKVAMWKSTHSNATLDQIEEYRLSLADQTLKAILSTQEAMGSTSAVLQKTVSFMNSFTNKGASGITGLTLEKGEE